MSWKDPVQQAYWERHGDAIRARRRARYAKRRASETRKERETRLAENRDKRARYQQAHSDRTRESSRRWRSKHWRQGRYGFTRLEAEQQLQRQKNQCAICQAPLLLAKVCVDHDHITGRFRGFLCRTCNLGLGHFGDSVSNLKQAQRYLEAQ